MLDILFLVRQDVRKHYETIIYLYFLLPGQSHRGGSANELVFSALRSIPQSGRVLPMMRLVLLMLLLCAPAAVPVVFAATPGEVQVGETLPEATMQGLNGPPRQLSEYRGKPLLINVWASWCGPCRAEMASLERLAWMDLAASFTVIGISTDDYTDKAKGALQASNATISHFIDANLQLENMLGASRLPLTVLVDAEGRVLKKIYGARAWDGAEALQLIADTFGIGAHSSGAEPTRPAPP
jgi:thiol-disulfide isomerase/thioredoxin